MFGSSEFYNKYTDFKDDNLVFNGNFFESRIVKNKKCFIIKGYLF